MVIYFFFFIYIIRCLECFLIDLRVGVGVGLSVGLGVGWFGVGFGVKVGVWSINLKLYYNCYNINVFVF